MHRYMYQKMLTAVKSYFDKPETTKNLQLQNGTLCILRQEG